MLRARGALVGAVAHGQEVSLYNGGGFTSKYALADTLQTFSSIGIVSRSLLVQPVISEGFREALLHQFPLPYSYGISFGKEFEVEGSSHSPPGTLTFRSRGSDLLPHKLQMGNSPLTRFSIV